MVGTIGPLGKDCKSAIGMRNEIGGRRRGNRKASNLIKPSQEAQFVSRKIFLSLSWPTPSIPGGERRSGLSFGGL